jgi:hypothetical protein
MYTTKPIEGFPKYQLTSDGRVQFLSGKWWKNRSFDTDKDGFRYVILSEWDNQRKVYLFALKFPRGEGYENVMRLKEEEERKLKRLKQKARRKLGRHHRGLKELRKSLQRYWKGAAEVDE